MPCSNAAIGRLRWSHLRRVNRVEASAKSSDMVVIAVEAIAAAALRTRLRSHAKVAVHVKASSWGILAGRLEGAKVEGRGWESPLGLTARILDVGVGPVELDVPAVFAQQQIVLRNVPVGSARVAFNAGDFGAFLQHPLVTVAARTAVQGCPFLFDRIGVTIIPGSGGGGGCVLLSGTLPANGQRYQLCMRPTQGGRAVAVAATPTGAMKESACLSQKGELQNAGGKPRAGSREDWTAATANSVSDVSLATAGSGEEDCLVSEELSRFFSGLLVDLQGAELTFNSMRISCGFSSSGRERGMVASAAGDAVTSSLVSSSGGIARGKFRGGMMALGHRAHYVRWDVYM
ncbi:hypothetical protein Vafri_1166 [Volvox africanus]|nr:hypothetical protein Vafri_1166 [Volvox africanus]